LDKSEKSFNGEDTKIVWDDIKLKKGSQYGIYNIQFIKASEKINKSVEYKVRPVLEEKDYAKAIRIYDNQLKKYNQKLEARKLIEKANKAQYLKDSLENNKIVWENERTEKLNKIIEAKNAQIEKINAETLEHNKYVANENLTRRTFRNFSFDQFGIWNCDIPIIYNNTITVQSNFVNNNGEPIKMYSANIFIKNFNGYFQILNNKTQVSKDNENMIVGVCDGRFAYINYDDFKKLNINTDTKSQTFPMQIVSEENNHYAYIRNIVMQ